jgi:hypothetical protein
MSATIIGDGESDVISQPAPTSCIQVPMFDATLAIHSARNSGWRSGTHTDELGGRSLMTGVVRAASFGAKLISQPKPPIPIQCYNPENDLRQLFTTPQNSLIAHPQNSYIAGSQNRRCLP